MKSGTRPAHHIAKEKNFHQKFGGVTIASIPDFNLDTGINGMPDQDSENAPTECTGYAVADILTDVFKMPFSPDFSYAAALYLDGSGPSIDGASFHAAMQAAVGVGVLPKALANLSATQLGELYISDWKNWNLQSKKSALGYVENGILNALGNGDAFDSILSSLYVGKISVSIGSPWFNEWMFSTNGVVATPALAGNYPAWHDWAIKGKITINGEPYLIGKSWQGTRVGNNGWLYFSRAAINAALSVPGSGALTFNPNALRWVSLIGILVQRFPALLADLPMLINAKV